MDVLAGALGEQPGGRAPGRQLEQHDLDGLARVDACAVAVRRRGLRRELHLVDAQRMGAGDDHVRVLDGRDGPPVLWAGPAHLPADVINRSAEIPATAKSAALGRQLDPAAYVLHRAWVGPMVLVVLDDPDDPTPYWLVSSRHPHRVLTALRESPVS